VIKITRVALVFVVSLGACVHRSGSSAPTAPTPKSSQSAGQASVPAQPPVVEQPVSVKSPPTQVMKATGDTAKVSSSDVNRLSAEVFGRAAKATVTDSGPSWDIDVESYASSAMVERYVRLFSGSAKERIESRLSRGTQYEVMIRTKMREAGLPEDMYYLALVESGFDPNAYSRAAAVGMWQFMTSTGRDMGLRIDWWVDERRDPFKSTSAAVRFIKGLNDQFGSLYLAAAAYNGGPGRVARGLTRYADDLEGTSGDDLFFALADKDYFRNETREYVPQLIAAALIAKAPERYGMSIETRPAIIYDSVRVGPATPLAAIAHAVDTDLGAVTELNSHVLRGMTPPKDSLFVRLPAGKAEGFAIAFEALPKSERIGSWTVVSRKGESLTTIGLREGLSARQLGSYNPTLRTLRSGKLAPGQTVLVPTVAVARAAASVPDPSVERYSSSRAATTHVVKSGETLKSIAKRYQTTPAALMKANGLKRPLIFAGQSLIVSGKATAAKSRRASASTASKASTTTATKTKAPATRPAPKKAN
jgi:membrane-bound lytic murein transglycosylase D